MNYEKISSFYGMTVKNYKSGDVIDASFAYRIDQEYEEGDEHFITGLLQGLIDSGDVKQLKALIIGNWHESYEASCQNVLDFMVKNVEHFSQLEAFFAGEMVIEECEISWIIQANYESFLNHFKQLKCFAVRGGNGLTLGTIDHENLETLVVETGGMPKDVADSIMKGNMPALQTLKLWLGTDEYGGDTSINQFRELLFGQKFPQLTKLGLMNCDYVDEIALTLKDAVVIDKLQTLDLSMGTLSDAGGHEILHNDRLEKLSFVNLRHHFLSNEMMNKLKDKFGDSIDLSDQEEEEDDYDDGEVYRYVAVGE